MSQQFGEDLPIASCLPEIVSALADGIPVVLKAPPGAGKTTGVPPALLSSGAAGPGQMLLVQPRRLAARAAASRLAHLLGVQLGHQVGYHVRFDRCASRASKLIAMTTGVLLRRLHGDPLLEDVSCVLLDEFHERSVEVDLALGMLHRIRTTLRPELKLAVMSATLQPEPIVQFLGDACGVTSEGRSFPVDIHYCPSSTRQPLGQQVASLLPRVLKATSGHILVFLPGLGEIRSAGRAIQSQAAAGDACLLELYGDLPAKDQDAVLDTSTSSPGRRRIILATNVAETSVTIPGVTGVIDSGLARVMRFDAHVGLPKLQLESISQASAEQRAGRAGRTQPGVCYRLWPAAAHRSRRMRDTPEIERSDFSDALLTLAAWGERDVDAFPFLSRPPRQAVATARRLLVRLGAIDEKANLTKLGRKMSDLPLPPRLARFMIESAKLGVEEDAALAAAMLTERDPFRGDRSWKAADGASDCDITDRVERLKSFLSGAADDGCHRAAAKQIKRVAQQIRRVTAKIATEAKPDPDARTIDAIRHALLAAYPDRLALRREGDPSRGLMVGRRGVRLDARSQVRRGELFLCIDIDSQGAEATVRAASAIDASWLDPQLIRESDEHFFDAELRAVVARRRRYFEDLMLAESPIACQPSPEVAAILAREAQSRWNETFPAQDDPTDQFIQRVEFLVHHMPQLELPPLDEAAIGVVLAELCATRTSIRDLRSAPWLDYLRARYDYSQLQRIDTHAPCRITVPSGNAIAIRYARGQPPAMRVRIQELFGWRETPRIAGGQVAVCLHLLGPNHRPQQITEDLANFWKETYAHVRKELRGRYPKHHWPEDPRNATATRNGLKPKS